MKTIKFTENKTKYEAPQVELVEVEVEKGFSFSEGSGGIEEPDVD